MQIVLNVNGLERYFKITNNMRLVDLLRDGLGVTSVKEGCGEGECGTCTILMNGKAVHSCMVMAFQANGAEIVTAEGLAENGELSELQKAFVENGAIQCGYCTPGMLMSAKALLMEIPNPTEIQIREAISGNLCRCTGYSKIVDSIKAASGNVEYWGGRHENR